MNRVKEILDEKGHDVLKIEGDASVFDAVKRMVEAGTGSLLVIVKACETEANVGMFPQTLRPAADSPPRKYQVIWTS